MASLNLGYSPQVQVKYCRDGSILCIDSSELNSWSHAFPTGRGRIWSFRMWLVDKLPGRWAAMPMTAARSSTSQPPRSAKANAHRHTHTPSRQRMLEVDVKFGVAGNGNGNGSGGRRKSVRHQRLIICDWVESTLYHGTGAITSLTVLDPLC